MRSKLLHASQPQIPRPALYYRSWLVPCYLIVPTSSSLAREHVNGKLVPKWGFCHAIWFQVRGHNSDMDGNLVTLRELVDIRAYCYLKVVFKTNYVSPEVIAELSGAIIKKKGLAAKKLEFSNFLRSC